MSTVPIMYSPGLSMIARQFLHCNGLQSIKSATRTTTLMPRFVPTYRALSFDTDLRMDLAQQQKRRQQGATNQGTRGGASNGNSDTELHSAVRSGNLGMLRVILKNNPKLIASQDEKGWTPLSNAAYKGDCDLVAYFLKKFPKSMSEPNKDGSFPIHKACTGGHIEVLKLFPSKYLSQGDRDGQTVLHLAAKEPSAKLKHVVSYLMSIPEGRKLLEREDQHEWRPLRWAVHKKNQGVIEIINRRMR